MDIKYFFTEEEKTTIRAAIQEAEKNTSGEIRVHLENKCPGDVLDRAAYLFSKLEMQKTELRNGVLFYIAVVDKKFAILGDAGINSVTPENYWDNIKEMMLEKFREEKFAEGIIQGITDAGNQLKTHFPYQKNDTNELPDDISYGKK